MHASRAALVFALIALTWSAGYIARSQPLIGPILRPRIVAQLKNLGADAIIQNMRPSGLTSITFTDVWLRIPRASWALEIHAEELTVTPSMSALLDDQPTVELIELKNAHITVKPWVAQTTPVKTPTAKPATTTPPAHLEPKNSAPLRLRVINATLHAEGPLATRNPFKIGRGELVWNNGQITELSGYGTLPDGVTAAASSKTSASTMRAHLQFERTSTPGAWFKRSFPLNLTLSGVDICPTCTEVVQARDLRVGHPQHPDFTLNAPAATLLRKGSNLELAFSEMQLDHARKSNFGARIMRSRIAIDLDTSNLELGTQLIDPNGGTLDVHATWADDLQADLTASRFDSSTVAAFLDIDRLHPGTVDGTLKTTLDLDHRIVEAEVDVSLRNPTLNVARISKSPLRFPAVALDFHALADLQGRALSVTQGNLTLGDTHPIAFAGHLLDAGKGWRFQGELLAQALDPTLFRNAMPDGIREIADNATYDGSFGFQLMVSGHTAYPADLIVDGTLEGDVSVLREGSVDVQTLSTNGAPPQLLKADLNVWRSYADLPEYLPKVLLAAEDAAFFGHPGFDWAGLRAAAIHNLEAGALERGGSTISQQVAKNLFLSPERTLARKLQEAYLTWRMESHVSKERILEIYLNLADWGGVVGIERAAQRYFQTSAAQLTVPEVALLAAILPSPTRFGAQIRNGKIDRGRAEKVARILQNLRFLGIISLEDFNTWNGRLQHGQIGRLNLTIQ